jgi:hypothetical protein
MRRWPWWGVGSWGLGVRDGKGKDRPVAAGPPTPNSQLPTPAPKALVALRPAPGGAEGRPGWWRAGGASVSGLLPPDETLDALLEEMRRTVPVLDRAITVLVQLAGEPVFTAATGVQAELEQWARQVRINQTGVGLSRWVAAHLDSLLLYGRAAGEIVPDRARRDVYALTNLDPRTVLFRTTQNPLELSILQRQSGGLALVELPKATTLLSFHAPAPDRPYGTSLYRSLPYVARVCRTIENATAQVWERLGAPPFHINWDPGDSFVDPSGAMADGVLDHLRAGWLQTMQAKGDGVAADFFTAGKVSIEIAGQHGPVVSITEPFRVFCEQLVGATGLPPWLLGLHWSATERMASQQAELLVAQIAALRRAMQPELERIIDLRQRLAGRSGRVTVGWSPVSLHDLTEQARGQAWREQAFTRRLHNAAQMWALGFWSQLQAAQYVDPTLTAVSQPLAAPPRVPDPGPQALGPRGD